MALDPILLGALIDGSTDGKWATVKIMGVRVRRFTLWHKFLLKAVDSPFMSSGKPVAQWDLDTAIGICRLEYPNSNIIRPRLARARFKLGVIGKALFTRKKPTEGEDNVVQAAFREHVKDFLTYTADYLQKPEYAVIPFETSGPMKPQTPRGRPPEEIEQIADLVAWSHWDDAKVWNLPIGYANWLQAMALKAAGADLDFTTDSEREFRKDVPEEYRNGK